MRLGEVLAGRSFSLHKVGHGVKPESINSQLKPELHDVPNRFADGRVVEVQVGLVTEESVPIIGFGYGIPGPVRKLRIQKNDARTVVAVIGLAPNVPIPSRVVPRTS